MAAAAATVNRTVTTYNRKVDESDIDKEENRVTCSLGKFTKNFSAEPNQKLVAFRIGSSCHQSGAGPFFNGQS